jgi:hypothetical protein
MSTCQTAIYGSGSGTGPVCEVDSDCYSGTCVKQSTNAANGNCVIPWGNPSPYLRACYVDKMGIIKSHV